MFIFPLSGIRKKASEDDESVKKIDTKYRDVVGKDPNYWRRTDELYDPRKIKAGITTYYTKLDPIDRTLHPLPPLFFPDFFKKRSWGYNPRREELNRRLLRDRYRAIKAMEERSAAKREAEQREFESDPMVRILSGFQTLGDAYKNPSKLGKRIASKAAKNMSISAMIDSELNALGGSIRAVDDGVKALTDTTGSLLKPMGELARLGNSVNSPQRVVPRPRQESKTYVAKK